MKIFIFSLLIGAALAGHHSTNSPNGDPEHRKGTNDKAVAFLGDWDWKSGSDPDNPEFYYVRNQAGYNKMYHVDYDGNCPNNNNWVPNQFEKVDRAYGFRGCEYFTVTVGTSAEEFCMTNIELCSEHGFTFAAAVNPDRTVEGAHWLASFGYGVNGNYGFSVGFEGEYVLIRSTTYDRDANYRCKLNNKPGLKQGKWYSLVIRRGLSDENAQVKMFINGKRVGKGGVNCDRGNNNPNIPEPTDTVREVVIGAAKDENGVIDSPYVGEANQICLFARMLGGFEIRAMGDERVSGEIDSGCYWIGSKKAANYFLANPN